MSKKHEAFGRLGDCSLAEFAELIRKRAFLDSLVKRAPAFSNFATGITVNVPLSPDPSAPTPEISPGLGPIGQFVFNFLLRWQLDQHVRQLSNGAGVSAEELPWVAMPVKRKIGYLKNEWQAADKLFGDGPSDRV